VIAEIGINHNGEMEIAKKLIEGAAKAGANAVKFQKRTPEICVPRDQWDIRRDTPWGNMTYIEYRHRMEFSPEEYQELFRFAKEQGVDCTASCWDEPAVDFMDKFHPPFYKAASASLTDISLLKKMKATGKPLIISTGMSTWEQIEDTVEKIGSDQLMIMHSTSAYPCKNEELNLRVIQTLQKRYPNVPIGYSGHETGLTPTIASVVLGACVIERHITLDRAMWGTDQAASVEIIGLERLVRSIRDVESSLGDGVKKLYESEVGPMKKLRRVQN
jgi:N-acetylneuraminate synthase